MRDNSPNLPRRNRFGWKEAPVILFKLSVNSDHHPLIDVVLVFW
jgi:hypothetical protein